MEAFVVDTNVILVAEGLHADISLDCQAACVRRLMAIQDKARVVLDDDYRILGEYRHKIDPNRRKGVGQVFLKWLLRNPGRQVSVALEEHTERGFVSFPEDDGLRNFDPADRKFVAVAAACTERPFILQAADSKWLGWSTSLKRHGIQVEFICMEDVQRFRRQKGAS
jgi:hypothetical protein